MSNQSKDWEAVQEMMSASGASFRSRTLYNYLSECLRFHREQFDALIALRDLREDIDFLIKEIEKNRKAK